MNTEHTLSAGEEPQALPKAELKPISAANRIDVMDILRGFALIGIIMMNIEWFNRSITELGRFDYTLTGADWSAGWMVKLFVEGKFYKLFSLLFGMGFAVMLIRAQEAGRPFGAWFTRRMLFLFLFGMAHMVFLWTGDILHDYAVGGLALLGWVFLLRWKKMSWLNNTRSFLRVGLVILSLPIVFSLGAGVYFGNVRTQDVMLEAYDQRKAVLQRAEEIKKDPILAASVLEKAKAKKAQDEAPETEQGAQEPELTGQALIEDKAEKRFISLDKRETRRQEEIQALANGSYLDATIYRAKEAVESLKETPLFVVLLSFPLFMVGYWFIASGVLREPRKHIGLFKAMTWVGLGGGSFMAVGALLISVHPLAKQAIEINAVAQTSFMLSQYLMTAGYLGGFVLMSLTARGQRWLSWLAPMGRMALTNYIMHSVILSTIFFGYAGGMHGEISRAPQMGIVVVIIAAQAVMSAWWLKHFQFGPLEWLWRSLTYLNFQPMRIVDKAETVPVSTRLATS